MKGELAALDWGIIAAYILFVLALGAKFAKKAGTGVESFFVGDRKLPWWLAGTSIVATTFAADTPLAVTGIVAGGGISGNWLWWSWGVAHVVSTFLFARMWRRSGVITDAEITELRYGGPAAAKLRVFKALYYAVFINCLTMAWVIAAMVKISDAFFDFPAWMVISVCVGLSVAYTTMGGFRSVVVTDVVQFVLGMGGAIALAWLVVDEFGGIGSLVAEGGGAGLLANLEEAGIRTSQVVADWLDFAPRADHPQMPAVAFFVLLLFGWWRYAEGNGYLVQRLASCKDEGHAQGASLWFAVAHNALRPWPWILVALAALVIFPKLSGHQVLTQNQISVKPAQLDMSGGELRFMGVSPDAIVRLGDQQVVTRRDGLEVAATFDAFKATGRFDLHVTEGERTTRIPGFRVLRLKDAAGATVPPTLVSPGAHISANRYSGEVTVRPDRLDPVKGGTLTLTGVTGRAQVKVGEQTVKVVDANNPGNPRKKARAPLWQATFAPFEKSGAMDITIFQDARTLTVGGLTVELTDREMAYPLMMARTLPIGLLGLVVASLLAAFMSTIDTHTNWGASYMVRDVYQRFIRPDAEERHYVWMSRLSILLMAILAGLSALVIQNIADVWRFLVTLGAGLGSVSAVRWYWSRVTPHAEFGAIAVTTVLAISLQLFCTPTLFGGNNPLFVVAVPGWTQILIIAAASIATWVPLSLWGPQNDPETLANFARKVRPAGPGWSSDYGHTPEPLWPALLKVVAGLVIVFGTLFGLSQLVLGGAGTGLGLLALAGMLLWWVIRTGSVGSQAPGDA